MTRVRYIALAAALAVTACAPVSGDQAPSATPVPTATPTAVPTPEPLPTYTPVPPYLPLPTYTPAPTYTPQTPVVIIETVVVTATPTPTITPTPVPTATPTLTPTPTATPRPPVIQQMAGTGSKVIEPRTFTPSRLLELNIEVTGSGAFSLNALAADASVVPVMSGAAPFTAKAVYRVSADEAFNSGIIPATGITWVVTASSDTTWKVITTQRALQERSALPYEAEGAGSSYTDVLLLEGDTEIVLRHGSFDKMTVDLLGVHGDACCESHTVFNAEDLQSGSAVLRNQRGVGEYIIRVRADQGASWELTVQ